MMGPTTLVQLATMDEVINIIVNVCLEQASATSGAELKSQAAASAESTEAGATNT